MDRIEKELFFNFIPITVKIPFQNGNLLSLLHEQGKIEEIQHQEDGAFVQGRVPVRFLSLFEPFFINPPSENPPDGSVNDDLEMYLKNEE